MEEYTRASIDIGTAKLCTSVADLKLRVAEHILTQYDCYGTNDISLTCQPKTGAVFPCNQ